MNNSSSGVKGIHLVGSAPVKNAEDMFLLATNHLSNHIKRLPDGEFGERDTWIRFQYKRLLSSPQLKSSGETAPYVPISPVICETGINSATQIEIPNLGYADAAIDSYTVFEKMMNKGEIATDLRFQIGLPTPYSVATFYGHASTQEILEKAYQNAIEKELARIFETIPHNRLAIQWETVTEFAVLEGFQVSHIKADIMNQLTSRVANLLDLVPPKAETGIHLCYGDSGHKHFCEPKDATYLAKFANGIKARSKRKMDWLHLPIPKERDDDKYFEPLSELALNRETELYLGIIHNTGGIEGSKRRISTAKRHVKQFGVSTECGLGRRNRETMPELLAQHRILVESNL